jgi:hypothetical protein
MVGRPKNPNKPAATRAVRLTERAHHKLTMIHQGDEPYGNTVERALDELAELRKKVKGLQLVIEGLETDLSVKTNAFDRLFNVHTETKSQLLELRR